MSEALPEGAAVVSDLARELFPDVSLLSACQYLQAARKLLGLAVQREGTTYYIESADASKLRREIERLRPIIGRDARHLCGSAKRLNRVNTKRARRKKYGD